MQEKPRLVVTSRTRRPETAPKNFAFTREMIPTGAQTDYRQHAWETFERLAIPTTSE